eukprot:NODE_460_length_8176_cov_0.585737.p4 type:complete len:156 gc:universal NODE_460_length_8176_cov_0.585737:5672-5205(-)
MSQGNKPSVTKHDSLLSLQNTLQDNTQYLQQLQDNNLGHVLKKVEEQLQENYVHLVKLEKNVEQLHVDMNNELNVSDKIEKIYTAISESQEKPPLNETSSNNESVDGYLLQRVSNRVDTLSRHFNHLNQSMQHVLNRQDAIDNKMDKILRKLDLL